MANISKAAWVTTSCLLAWPLQKSSNRISVLVGHYLGWQYNDPLIILAIRSIKTCRCFFPWGYFLYFFTVCLSHSEGHFPSPMRLASRPPPTTTTNAKLAGVFPLAKGYVSSFKLRISQRCCEAIMSFLEHMPLPISYIITHDWKYIHGKMSWTNISLHDMLSMLFILKGRDYVSSGPGWHISHMSYQKKHLVFHCTGFLIRDCYNGLLKTLYNWVV